MTSPRFLPPFRASDTVSAPGAKYDPQPLNAWLARRIPGGWAFGPMVDSIRNTTRLWMRDPEQARAALAVLDTLAPHGPLIAATYPDSIVPSRTRWDYAELYDWMAYLRGSGGANGVAFTAWSIDPFDSRLMFGIETREMVPQVVAWFVSKRIPCRLVTVLVTGKFSTGEQPRLDSRF